MKTIKKLKCAYLYEDGHAVLCWEKKDNDAGEVEWVELHEKFCDAQMNFKGRLVIHNPPAYLKLAKMAKQINASEASLQNGSENTKKRSIQVGNVSFVLGEHWFSDAISFTLMPELISSPFTYQPETVEKWEDVKDGFHWGNNRVGKVYASELKKPAISILSAS